MSFSSEEFEINYDYLFKIVIVGDSNVGKTSLITKYCTNIFPLDIKNTIGVDFKTKDCVVGDKKVSV